MLASRPVIYEINTWLWLRELSRRYDGPVTLGTIPPQEWDALAALGLDAIWFMGIWERSPAGVAMALKNETLQQAFLESLPDITMEDVVGSPYCVRRYQVDPALGGREGLAMARAELARRGVAIILDFVPNHVAPDHPWILSHPEYFIQGSGDDLARAPGEFFQAGSAVIANGRDPFFPPWPDVAQLNAFHAGLRGAIIDTLIDIGAQCDGLRCDMAMLLTTSVFGQTWGERAGTPPAQEFWLEILPAVRAKHPHLRFIAEVYWDMEWAMQEQGFDYCYDKKLYDYLAHHTAKDVIAHLNADIGYQERLVRFIENHDEPRAAGTFSREQARAVAVAALTLPGAKLLHQGQFEGFHVRLPVFLTRRPEESDDISLQNFYRRLLPVLRLPPLRAGEWRACALNGWPDNTSFENLVAWCWRAGDDRAVVVVNLSAQPSQARVQLPWPDLAQQHWVFEDRLAGQAYERSGDEILNMGLYVDLPPWGHHVFMVY
jgi:glycosidase